MINITAKNTKSCKTSEFTEDAALNLARSAILMLDPMEETSADLMAIDLMNKVDNGKPQVIENTDNGNQLIFRKGK